MQVSGRYSADSSRMSSVTHDWTRFWTKPDGQISLADQGFLVGPSGGGLLAEESRDLWAFEEIAKCRCLILLGEPGIGKSTTLDTEAAAVADSCADTGDL